MENRDGLGRRERLDQLQKMVPGAFESITSIQMVRAAGKAWEDGQGSDQERSAHRHVRKSMVVKSIKKDHTVRYLVWNSELE